MSDDMRTLAELEDELNPQGRKVADKTEIMGEVLIVQRFNVFKGRYGESIFVVAVVESTGELINTVFGSGMASKLAPYREHVPFKGKLVEQETAGGTMFILE